MGFDLENDRWEENNLIDNPELTGLADHLREKLDIWMLDFYDTGLLTEGEMMIRAYENNTSVYEMARTYSRDKMRDILAAAQKVGKINDPSELESCFEASDSFIRFWALVALDAFEGDILPVRPNLEKLLHDPSPDVAVKAAGIMIKRYESKDAYRVLEEILAHHYEPVVLQAAIGVRQLEEKAEPLLPAIENKIMPKYSGNVWGRYRTWSYPMFIGMALDQAMINCGIDVEVQR
jgi:N-sulfoglucosamine sulfohydrolase